MNVSIVVAMSSNGVIGRNGDLPWHLSADLKHFKSITMGKPIVMGRKTHESIGRPLPGRENIILTTDKDFVAERCTIKHTLDDVYSYCEKETELMIIGGAVLYEQTLDKASKLYITEVHASVNGDIWFPEFDRDKWNEISREDFKADEKNDYDYSFVVLEKI